MAVGADIKDLMCSAPLVWSPSIAGLDLKSSWYAVFQEFRQFMPFLPSGILALFLADLLACTILQQQSIAAHGVCLPRGT